MDTYFFVCFCWVGWVFVLSTHGHAGASHWLRAAHEPESRVEGRTVKYLTTSTSLLVTQRRRFPDGSVVKNPPANAGDTRLIPGSGTSPGEGHGNPLRYSCLGNPMNRGARLALVHRIAKKLEITGATNQQRHKGARIAASSLSCSITVAKLSSQGSDGGRERGQSPAC